MRRGLTGLSGLGDVMVSSVLACCRESTCGKFGEHATSAKGIGPECGRVGCTGVQWLGPTLKVGNRSPVDDQFPYGFLRSGLNSPEGRAAGLPGLWRGRSDHDIDRS